MFRMTVDDVFVNRGVLTSSGDAAPIESTTAIL